MNEFRVWSNKKNQYVVKGNASDVDVWEEYTIDSRGTLFVYSWRDSDTHKVDVEPEMFPTADIGAVVERFSGLYDSQDTPLFPGDIVQITIDNHNSGFIVNLAVGYRQGAHYFVYGDLCGVELSDYLHHNNLDALVVGNIHENPDIYSRAGEETKTKGLDTRATLLTKDEKQGIIMAKENGTSFVNFYEEVLHQSTAIKFGTQSTPELYKGVSEEELMKAWLYPEITKEVD